MLTVVVPTCNRPSGLLVALRSLLAQSTDDRYEIIVVDNYGGADTRSIIESLPSAAGVEVRYVAEPVRGSSYARNAGISASRGEFVAFMDDDMVASPAWLQSLADCFRRHPEAWVVGGRITLGLPARSPVWFHPELGLTSYLGRLDLGADTMKLSHPFSVFSGNAAVRRSALERLGGFDVRLGRTGTGLFGGEDTEFFERVNRAGGVAYYCGRATAVHTIAPARLRRGWFRCRAFFQGRTDVLIAAIHPAMSGVCPSPARIALRTAKSAARMLQRLASGDLCGAFESEFHTWVGIGRLYEIGAGVHRRIASPADAPRRLAPR